jgi:hypothetical protein
MKEHRKKGGQAEFGLTSHIFRVNFQKIKSFNFSEKKLPQKKFFFRNSKPLFILPCPASKKT